MSCTHYSGRKGVFIIRINGHLVQCRALENSLEAAYFSHARNKPFVYLVRRMLLAFHFTVNVVFTNLR